MKTDEFAALEQAVSRQIVLEDTVEDIEEQLKQAKYRLNRQNTEEVPLAMTLAGVAEFTTVKGQKVKVASFISGGIDKDDPDPAYEALKAAGEESLIKWTITLKFGKDEQEKAEKAFDYLVEDGYEPTKELGVHHSSLGAVLKRHFMDPGFPLMTIFDGFTGRKSKITRPKR